MTFVVCVCACVCVCVRNFACAHMLAHPMRWEHRASPSNQTTVAGDPAAAADAELGVAAANSVDAAVAAHAQAAPRAAEVIRAAGVGTAVAAVAASVLQLLDERTTTTMDPKNAARNSQSPWSRSQALRNRRGEWLMTRSSTSTTILQNNGRSHVTPNSGPAATTHQLHN